MKRALLNGTCQQQTAENQHVAVLEEFQGQMVRSGGQKVWSGCQVVWKGGVFRWSDGVVRWSDGVVK